MFIGSLNELNAFESLCIDSFIYSFGSMSTLFANRIVLLWNKYFIQQLTSQAFKFISKYLYR